MKKSKMIFIGIGIIILAVILLFFLNKGKTATFENGKKVYLEVANNPLEIQKGLMGVEKLKENEGMLFVFEDEIIRRFWMKNTLIDLDILFLDEKKEIVSINTMKACKEDPCIEYSSNNPAMYAIELNAGYAIEKGIQVGQKVNF